MGATGCLLIGVGAVLAVRAATRCFLKQLDTATISPGSKPVVTRLGVGEGVARGVVFAAAGILILVAAIRYDPHDAQGRGRDAPHLHADTGLGPWLLVAVAIGLILFGIFSFASARWRYL
ncbi:DUF1206 domain-containing protein [Streptomyces sp. NBC_01518]|uniref:DUF1206 domain-containing protein n=1 Tax=Streptomyces sp. NBC_01518 TaxID=2903891 RepID=UPI00386D88F7